MRPKNEPDETFIMDGESIELALVPEDQGRCKGCGRCGILLVVIAVLCLIGIAVGVGVPLSKRSSKDSGVSDWVQLGDTLHGQALGDRFGYSVAASADAKTIAVAAISNDESKSFRQVQAYRHDGMEWKPLGQALTGASPEDDFGWAVSLSKDGETLAVGSQGGYVRVYTTWKGLWVPMGQAFLTAENIFDSCFGCAIALSPDGSTLAVGAEGAAGGTGQVQVFRFELGWVPFGQALNGDAANDAFGKSLDLSEDGTMLVVGADQCCDGSGYVRAFQYESGAWNLMGANVLGEAAGDRFGYKVSLSSDGGAIAVGSPRNNGSGTGLVRVLGFSGDSWEPMGEDVNGEDGDSQFGISLDLSSDGKTLVAGVNLSDGSDVGVASSTGRVRVYGYDDSRWVQLRDDLAGEAAGDEFGWSVAISGDGRSVVASSLFGSSEEGERTGHVRVFEAAE